MTSPLRKPDGLNWNPATVEMPEIPMIPPGEDAMSATISAVLPTLGAPLAANVAALSAKENAFTGKLGVAQTAYQNTDDSGGQAVGQLTSMLGQLGQMGQQAGGAGQGAGQGGGMFSSLMEQVMKAAQSAGGDESPAEEQQGGPMGGGMAGAPGHGAPGAQQGRDGDPQLHDEHDRREEPARTEEPLRAEDQTQDQTRDQVQAQAPVAPPVEQGAAGPDSTGHGPAPVAQPAAPPPVAGPEVSRPGGDDDLARRM